MPLGSYTALMGVYGAGVGAALVAAERSGHLPDRFTPADVLLLSVATHRLTRTVSRDEVTRAMRAPFTVVRDDEAPPGELSEQPRPGSGPRRALGKLLSCTACLDQWTAGLFVCGFLAKPDVTRAVSAIFTVKSVADVLNIAYARYA